MGVTKLAKLVRNTPNLSFLLHLIFKGLKPRAGQINPGFSVQMT